MVHVLVEIVFILSEKYCSHGELLCILQIKEIDTSFDMRYKFTQVYFILLKVSIIHYFMVGLALVLIVIIIIS